MKQFDLDTWEEILVTITRNKTRSLLTAFGIFWGIFMLISLLGGAKGMQETLSLQFKGFATNSGFMGTNQTSKAYRGFQQGRYWDLENKDVERILRNVEGADVVTPTLARWGVNIVYNEQKISGTLKGLYPIYSQIEEPLITQGRYLNDMDVRDNRKVCIIGKQIYESLFPGGENPCGKYIEINGIYYQVIGVNMGTGNVSIQGNTETSVIIPFSTMQNNYNFGQKVQMIAYTARKGYAISEVEKDIARIVKQAHLIHPDDDQALVQLNAEVLFGMMDNLFSGIRILGWMVGLGTLLAGIIGVSNIMMVTVKERTKEIGVRRALGAKPFDIISQVMSESLMLTAMAGLLGLSCGVFLLDLANRLLLAMPSDDIIMKDPSVNIQIAIAATVVLLVSGLMAGLIPAWRAMQIKAIDALRDE